MLHLIPEWWPSLILVLPYLVAGVASYFILWQPLVQYLYEREAATEGTKAEAAKLTASTAGQAADLEGKLLEVRRELASIRAEGRQRASTVETQILNDARDAANAKVDAALATIRTEQQTASATLKSTATALSQDIVNSLLAQA